MISLAIIDDEVLFRKGMALLIQGFDGIRLICEADQGQELLDQLAEGVPVPDAVLLDLKSPTQDGLKNTRLLATRYPKMRIILLLPHFSKTLVLHLLEIGVAAFLPRNATADELERHIREAVEKGFCYNDSVREIIREKLMNKKQAAFPALEVQVSDREKDILELICGQYTHPEIAGKLFISPRAVEWHRKNLLKKLNCRNTAGLVALAIQLGLVQVNPSGFWR